MKMRTIFVILLLLPHLALSAQRSSLLGGEEISHGGFGGPLVKITALDDEFNVMDGVKGAWLIQHRLYFGANLQSANDGIGDTRRGMFFGGPIVGYIGRPQRLIHYSLEIGFGAGDLIEDHSNDHGMDFDNDLIWVVEPSAYLSLNLVSFATLNAGVSYRFVRGSDTSTLGNQALSGLSFDLNVIFGKF